MKHIPKRLIKVIVVTTIAGARIARPGILVMALQLAGFILASLCGSLKAGTTTEPEGVLIGDLYTSNWRSAGFVGSAARTWSATGESFSFAWRTQKGNQIGRIGKSVFNPGMGVRVDDIRDECIMSATASMTNLVSSATSWHMWSVYRWTHDANMPC